MRGIGTWALVGAVCVLGLAALVDSFAGGGDSEPKAKPLLATTAVTDEFQGVPDMLRQLDVRGEILYADTECRLHTVHLPTLVDRRAPFAPSCEFTMSPKNVWSPDAAAISPGTGATAVCLRSGGVQVRAADGSTVDVGPGCPAAWTPGSTLTVVRDGALLRLDRRPGGGFDARPVLSRADLARELARTPWARSAPFVREAAWLTDDTVAVIVGGEGAVGDAVAIFRNGRLVKFPLGPYRRLARLRPSPRGSFVSAVFADGRSDVVADASGELVAVPPGYAIAWSPDETFGLSASPGGTVLFASPAPGNAVTVLFRLPIVARDLVWN